MTRRGFPDWGVPDYGAASVGVDPSLVTEYAAYGFSRMDGLGRPVLVDRFNDGLRAWELSGTGAAVVSNAAAFVSPVGLLLTTTGAAGTGPKLTRIQTLQPASRMGLEVAVSRRGLGAPGPHVHFSVIYGANNGLRYIMQLSYNATVPVGWDILTTAGAVRIGSSHMLAGLPAVPWQTVKVVANFETGEYTRALISGSIVNLSQYMMTSTGGNGALAEIGIEALVRALPGEASGIGYFVLTRDEVK